MIFQFQEKVINDSEYSKYNFENPNFIGYLNNYGEVLSCRNPLGLGDHDSNKTTEFFEYNFRMPTNDLWLQKEKEINVINKEREERFAKEQYEYFKKRVENDAKYTKEYGRITDVDNRLLRDLNMFFYNCYQAPTFMEGFGQNCKILNEAEFYEKYCKGKEKYQKQQNETNQQYNERFNQFFKYDYYWYKTKIMLDWYKTVIVQYLHYNLIERCKKGITTCTLNPNETFYNYLLNDFEIHQIPRMIFDSDKKMYVPYSQSEFFIPDSELRLHDEIQTIKKLVPLKERSRYYR